MKVVNLRLSGEAVSEFSVLGFLQAYSFQVNTEDTLHAGSHF